MATHLPGIRDERGFQASLLDLGTPLRQVPFVVLDLETTGGSPADCEITEIGAVKYVGGELTGTFHTLVDPGVPIPPTITVLTGITQAMVIEAPRITEALPALFEFVGDAVVVGHNVRFDMSFLDAAAQRLGYGRFPNRRADTLALARRLVGEEVRSLRLSSLAAHFRSPVTPTHRALDDAKATAHVFFELLERAGALGATHLEDLMRLPTARGRPHYDKIALTDGLPRRPGVYLFADLDGEVIYVGKAKNLRSRVRSYFYGDTRRTIATMMRVLRSIDHVTCATELEAEITEVRLIHAHRPRFNRRSRPPKSSHWVRLTDERFPRLSLVRSIRTDALAHLGPFRSRRRAQLVMNALWDATLIRRCLTKGGRSSAACRFAELGVALCPCDGSIDEPTYRRLAVEPLLSGIDADPAALLDPLAERIRRVAHERRFEEAAELRDRHRALETAIADRQRWRALEDAGLIWAERSDGVGALVDHGRFVASWRVGGAPPLTTYLGEHPGSDTPGDVALAEEARLVWRWLDDPEVRIVDTTRPLTQPLHRPVRLERLAG
jgi:DNA polymerase-3 subunit epsilon